MPETTTNTLITTSVKPLNPDTVYNDYERLSNIALSNYVNNIISKLNNQIETAAKSLQPLEVSYIIADLSQEDSIIYKNWNRIKNTITNLYDEINNDSPSTSKDHDYIYDIDEESKNIDNTEIITKVTITLKITNNNSSN